MFQQVPVLPVVVPLAAAAFVVMLLLLRRRGRLSLPRAAVALALCVYLAGVVANTVFPIFLDKPADDAPWDTYLSLVPLLDYEVPDAVMNVLVFVPLGMLAPLLVPEPSWRRVVAVAAAVSLLVEVTQYVTAHVLGGGHVADVNDLVFNILGGALGYGVLRLLSRVSAVSALVERFRGTDLHPDASPAREAPARRAGEVG